jgi:hypothetical protein
MLPTRYLKLFAFLRAASVSADLTSLSSRIVLQKRVYFAQAFGIELGYRFGWYVFGPYSTELTRDAYGLQGLESRLEGAESKEKSAEMKKLNEFFGEVKALGPRKGERYWLELLSSLHFLTAHAAPPIAAKDQCIAKIKLMKPDRFSQEDMELAWNLLAKYHLVAS